MTKQTKPTPTPEPASTSDVTFSFVQREDGPERLVCEAELVFPATAGILAGLKLVGFSLWRSPEGEIYVTFPSRAFGTGLPSAQYRGGTPDPPGVETARRCSCPDSVELLLVRLRGDPPRRCSTGLPCEFSR